MAPTVVPAISAASATDLPSSFVSTTASRCWAGSSASASSAAFATSGSTRGSSIRSAGTPDNPAVYTYTARSGDRLHALDVDFSRVADYYKGDPDGGYRAFVYTDSLSSEAIVQARDWIERDVRAALGIPYQTSRAAQRFEHSMGMGPLPGFIVRTSALPLEVTG